MELLEEHGEGAQHGRPCHVQHRPDRLALGRLEEGGALGALPARTTRELSSSNALKQYEFWLAGHWLNVFFLLADNRNTGISRNSVYAECTTPVLACAAIASSACTKNCPWAPVIMGAHRSVSCRRRTASSLGSLDAAARRPGMRFRMVSIHPPPPLAAAAAAIVPSAPVSCHMPRIVSAQGSDCVHVSQQRSKPIAAAAACNLQTSVCTDALHHMKQAHGLIWH